LYINIYLKNIPNNQACLVKLRISVIAYNADNLLYIHVQRFRAHRYYNNT